MGNSFRFLAWWIIFVGFLELIHARETNNSVTRILDELLKAENYDSRLRPNYDGGPVEVVVGFWVLSIDAINVIDMDFSLDIFFRQEWKDGRLAHGLNKTMFLSNTVTDRIWMPDTYFVNAKNGKFHRVTSDNLMIMILPGGLVKFNVRLTIKAACPMDLRKFPMDTQHCPLMIESYGYSRDHITFKWEQDSTDGMQFVPSTTKMLPQYSLVEMSLTQIQNTYVVGKWSGIKATFTFERMYSYFIIHVYGPCALIVIISWLSFLLPRSSPPARVTLGVTSVLTVVTILNMLNNSMPKVNYVKTIDKYLIGCFLFVFATLAEYALVLFLANRMKRRQMTKDSKKEDNSKARDNCHSIANGHVVKRKWNPEKVCSTELELMEFSNAEGDFVVRGAKQKNKCIDWEKWRERLYNEKAILAVEEYALVVFPLSFLAFNVIYWLSVISSLQTPAPSE